MGHHLSPEIREELANCNSQNSNKKCLIVSLNNDFQFMLEGYTLQTEDVNSDIKNLKSILSDSICFILINVNRFTPKYKWMLLLWHPDEKTEEELQQSLKNEANDKQNNKTENAYAKKIENGNNYKNKKYYLNKLIYSSLKNAILDALDNDSSIPLLEIKNFKELEKCMWDANKNVVNDNLLTLQKNMKQTDCFNSTVKTCICENYNLNVQARNCFIIKETEDLNQNMELLIKDDFMSLNIFTFDMNDVTLMSEHLKITNIAEVQQFFNQKNICYTLYKILDTYTLFFYCNEKCDVKEKFLYSIYKPRIIEFLKRKNASVFLSVEINKLKYLIEFINLDMKTQTVPTKSKEFVFKPIKAKYTYSGSRMSEQGKSKDQRLLRREYIKSKSESTNKKTFASTNFLRSGTLKKKSYASSKTSSIKRSETAVNFKLPEEMDKKKEPVLKAIKAAKKKNSFTSITALKKNKVSIEKKKLTKANFNNVINSTSVKSKKPNITHRKKFSVESDKTKKILTLAKTASIDKKTPHKSFKKKSTLDKKGSFILDKLKTNYEIRRSVISNKKDFCSIDRMKIMNHIYADSISSYSQIHSDSSNSKATQTQVTPTEDARQTDDSNQTEEVESSGEIDEQEKKKNIYGGRGGRKKDMEKNGAEKKERKKEDAEEEGSEIGEQEEEDDDDDEEEDEEEKSQEESEEVEEEEKSQEGSEEVEEETEEEAEEEENETEKRMDLMGIKRKTHL